MNFYVRIKTKINNIHSLNVPYFNEAFPFIPFQLRTTRNRGKACDETSAGKIIAPESLEPVVQ